MTFCSENLKGRRMGDNIKVALEEIEHDGVDRIQLAQHRIQWQTCENGNEPLCSIKGWEFFDQLSDSF
jgi:hypothetical protein